MSVCSRKYGMKALEGWGWGGRCDERTSHPTRPGPKTPTTIADLRCLENCLYNAKVVTGPASKSSQTDAVRDVYEFVGRYPVPLSSLAI
jgi:hypothetical protein